MTELLFPTFDLTVKQVDLVTTVYDTLKPSFPEAVFDFDFKPSFSSYEAICGNYTTCDIGPVMHLCGDPPDNYLCFTKVQYHLAGGKYHSLAGGDFQTWGVAVLQQKYGHVLIRPETMADKICELIHHAEVDFTEDREFSHHFYVVASKEDDARKLLGPGLRQSIAALRLTDFMIEVVDNVMIVGDNKAVDPTTAGEMASFLCGLSRLTQGF
jgi:hypothetical protein